MNNIYFHIGLHKTATTWMQKELFSNIRDVDFYSDDFLYENLIRSHENSFEATKFSNAIKVNTSSTLLVYSSERLSGNPHSGTHDSHEIAERIRQVCPKAKIILIVRSQISMIVSNYKQYVKSGGTCTIEEYILPPKDGRIPLFRLNSFKYEILYKHYVDLFGQSNVLILQYENLKSNQQNFVEKIFKFMQISDDQWSKKNDNAEQNISLSDFQIILIRFLNIFGTDSSLTPHKTILYKLARKLVSGIKKYGDNIVTKQYQNDYFAKVHLLVGDYYLESNKELSELTSINFNEYT